ncbi:hypothetical protein Csa_021379 [Cucumis sativus]|nr:hypothetical protein Csa_021374 [Cucumis sativus]KAE8645928.1 hypothetical protein Csa_021379 [Cucumis sativus]
MSPEPIVGDYRPCENSDGEHAKDVAQWAVTEYNIKHRPEGHYLYLVRVLKCESQVVAGTNWRLLLECKDENNCVEIYQAVVWEKVWENFRQLTSFVRIIPVLSHE